MSKTVFVVTDGYYSDYRLLGIYSTRELAEEGRKLYAADHEVGEWELDDFPKHPKGRYRYAVVMWNNGDVPDPRLVNAEENDRDSDETEAWETEGEETSVRFLVWAKDEIHAVKIANERRGRLIASNKWPKPEVPNG